MNQQNIENKTSDVMLEVLFKFKSKQFEFDNGLIMGSVKYSEIEHLPISLKYHANLSFNAGQFVSSVIHYILSLDPNYVITDYDREKLNAQYDKP